MIPQPILLIHGFNGAPSNWTGPHDQFPEYLDEHGYDSALIRVFSYGYDFFNGKRSYNNLGDMRQIAHRLDQAESDDPELQTCSVDRLSRDSAARGGPSKITIIAHSSGGLIARYYLTRQQEDDLGTRYRGNVGRVIFLGTPHQGVDIEDILDPLPTNFLLYRLMVRLHYMLPPEYHEQAQSLRAQFRDMRREARQPITTEGSLFDDESASPAFKELHPGSDFLRDINRPGAMPLDIAYFNIIGDIRARVRFELVNRSVLDHEKSFGDMLVSTGSAGEIPNAPSHSSSLVQQHSLQVDLSRHLSRLVQLTKTGEQTPPLHRWLRSLPDARERILKILQHTV